MIQKRILNEIMIEIMKPKIHPQAEENERKDDQIGCSGCPGL